MSGRSSHSPHRRCPTELAHAPCRRLLSNDRGAVVAAATAPARPKQQPWVPPTGILKINPEILASGGLEPSRDGPEAKSAFDAHVTSLFFPIDLDTPGLRVLNIDPPVLTISGFLSPEECNALVEAASGSGLMRQSGIGGVSAAGSSGQQEAYALPSGKEDIRTSSTLAATADTLKQQPALAAAWEPLLVRARALLKGPVPAAGSAAQFAKPSGVGQLAFELPQVARYQPGQHFLTHEDAFPVEAAVAKGYQRRATLLVYLNDCTQGGATRFEVLDIAVQPSKGMALLFFPSFKNGVPDRRTLHTAQDAVDEKWVTQLWLSCGLARPQQAGALPAFVRGVNGAKTPQAKGRARLVPPQRKAAQI